MQSKGNDGRGQGGIGIWGEFFLRRNCKKVFFLSIYIHVVSLFLGLSAAVPFFLLHSFFTSTKPSGTPSSLLVQRSYLFFSFPFPFSLLTRSFSFVGSVSGVHFPRRCMAF